MRLPTFFITILASVVLTACTGNTPSSTILPANSGSNTSSGMETHTPPIVPTPTNSGSNIQYGVMNMNLKTPTESTIQNTPELQDLQKKLLTLMEAREIWSTELSTVDAELKNLQTSTLSGTLDTTKLDALTKKRDQLLSTFAQSEDFRKYREQKQSQIDDLLSQIDTLTQEMLGKTNNQ